MSNKPNPLKAIQEKLRSLFAGTEANSDKKPGASKPVLNSVMLAERRTDFGIS